MQRSYLEQVKPFNFMLVAFPDTGDITTGGEAYWEDRGDSDDPHPRPARRPIRHVHYVNERAEWERDKQILRTVPRRLLAKWTGLHVRSVKAILNTKRLPHRGHRRILHEIAEKLRRRDSGLLNTIPAEVRLRPGG